MFSSLSVNTGLEPEQKKEQKEEKKSEKISSSISPTPRRKNSREASFALLASVNPEKQEEDDHFIKGEFLSYFKRNLRKELAVEKDEKNQIFYLNSSDSSKAIKNGKYMYVVSRTGCLYISDFATIHSQIKAGKKVQCAGHLEVKGNRIVKIMNDSGHYTPTLMMFLSCISGLVKEGYLAEQFKIGITKNTKMDSLEMLKKNFEPGDYDVVFKKDTNTYTFVRENKTITITQQLLDETINTMTEPVVLPPSPPKHTTFTLGT